MDPPPRLTALYHKHLALNGKMVESEGWILPERYSGPEDEAEAAIGSVGLSDCSANLKVDVRGDRGEIDGFLSEVLPGQTVAAVPGQVTSYPHVAGDRSVGHVCRLTYGHALLVLRPRRVPPRTSPLEPEIDLPRDHRVYLTNATSVLSGITLIGPSAPNVLSRLSSISLQALPDPGCTEGGVAGIQCAIVRSAAADLRADGDGWLDSFDLYFGRGYAEYLWDSLSEAGRGFRIVPVGTAALASIRGVPPGSDAGTGLEG